MSRQAIGVIAHLKTRAAHRVNSAGLDIGASDLMPVPSPLERRQRADGSTMALAQYRRDYQGNKDD